MAGLSYLAFYKCRKEENSKEKEKIGQTEGDMGKHTQTITPNASYPPNFSNDEQNQYPNLDEPIKNESKEKNVVTTKS